MKKLGPPPAGAAFWLPGNVWDADGLNLVDRFIYAHVYSMCERTFDFFGSNAYLARMAGISESRVKQSLKILRSAGLIARTLPGEAKIRRRHLEALRPWEGNPDWTFTLEQRKDVEKASKGAETPSNRVRETRLHYAA